MAITKTCEHCGTTFEAERSTARFCSARCRVAYNRGNTDTGSAAMTPGERRELRAVVKQREKVAKTEIDAVAAERLADFEQQIATIYKPADDRVWEEATRTAEDALREAQARIIARCDELGIPPECRPGLALQWYGRGSSGARERRAELRSVAKTRIEADSRKAKTAIERASVERQEAIVAGALTTTQAQGFLASMPEPDALLPQVSVEEIEAVVADTNAERHRRLYGHLNP